MLLGYFDLSMLFFLNEKTNVSWGSLTDKSTGFRRQVLEGGALLAVSLLVPGAAEAKGPKGFLGCKDAGDGYEFLYPFGWQEVSVKGVDAVFKDVIEPLESVSVQVCAACCCIGMSMVPPHVPTPLEV